MAADPTRETVELPTDRQLLLLLHGMDGVGAVWEGVIEQLDGSCVALAPDLAGHGAAPRLLRYALADYAEDLVSRFGTQLAATPFIVVGHSLGAAVGLKLAATHPELDVQAVVASSCKTVWSDQDLAGAARVADKGVMFFDDEASAIERFCKVSGLVGLATDAQARHGVTKQADAWRLAVDPEAHRVEAIDFESLLASVPCPALLATGEHDTMAPASDLARFGLEVHTIAGAGHNVHVENPAAIVELVRQAQRLG